MSRVDRATLESSLLELHAAGDFERLAHELVEGYGPEVLGFLVTLVGQPDRAQDAFQAVCEDVLRALPGFRGQASFRTWLYAIARNRASKIRGRGPRDEVPLSRSPAAARLAAAARSATAPHLRTELKEGVRALRAQLSEDEQALLVLRVDRAMDWLEIAAVMEPEAQAPERVASRLRKQFQRTKDRLRELVQQSGMLESEDDREAPRE